MTVYEELTTAKIPTNPADFSAHREAAATTGAGYQHTTAAGTTYYLHQSHNLRYFSRTLTPARAIALPPGYVVTESEKTGMPMLKRIG